MVRELKPPFTQEFNPVTSQNVLEGVIYGPSHLTISHATGFAVQELCPDLPSKLLCGLSHASLGKMWYVLRVT